MVVKSEMDSKIKLIQEWIKENRHLPQKIGKITKIEYICKISLLLFVVFFYLTILCEVKVLDLLYVLRNSESNSVGEFNFC